MKKTGIFISLLIILVISAACTPTNGQPQTAAVDEIYTMAAETVIAELTLTAAVSTATIPATATYIPAGQTATPVPTSTNAPITPSPIPTETATPVGTDVAEVSPTDEFCDNAAWVADISVQDGTEMSPGQAFEKTWRIQNTGTCIWTEGHKLAFGYGENMNGQARPLDRVVNPNENVDVMVVFSAPLSPGSYQSYWRMSNTAGVNFGDFFYVDIVVR